MNRALEFNAYELRTYNSNSSLFEANSVSLRAALVRRGANRNVVAERSAMDTYACASGCFADADVGVASRGIYSTSI